MLSAMRSGHIPSIARSTYPEGYERRCVEHLDQALRAAPAYRAWRACDPGPAVSVDERYAALPVTTKKELRAHFPDGFIAPESDREAGLRAGLIEYVQTSGTTDERVTTIWNQRWWDASERASWKLNRQTSAATGAHREAILTSPLNTGVRCDEGTLPMELRIVDGAGAGSAREAAQSLHAVYGSGAGISVVTLDAIPAEPSGKHRLALAEMPVDIEALVDRRRED
jgi:phenylacetate-coenzyme A ligase PaaK-like adenylate-forming protein